MKLILLLILTLFTGCVQTRSTGSMSHTSRHKDADSAFWGQRTDADGTEYFRMGRLLIKTKGVR